MNKDNSFNQTLCINLSAENEQELEKLFVDKGIHFDKKTPSNLTDGILPFDADSIQSIVVALGSSGAIAAITKTLIEYIRGRRKEILIQNEAGKLQVMSTNMDAEDLEKIIHSLKEKEDIVLYVVDGN